MQKYKVTKIMKYTETIEVVAEDSYSAILQSYVLDGEYNNDDYLYDVQAVLIEE